MKKFPWDCGDCPLLSGWDMSCDDMTYKCLWSKRQIDDCDRHLSDVCPMEQHDKEIRNKSIDEVIDYINTHRFGWQDLSDFLEQLKGEQHGND